MIITTTPTIENRAITEYLGIVTGESIAGVNVVKDIFASFTDFFGGRSETYEAEVRKVKDQALKELEEKAKALGADAVVGVDFDFETVGGKGSMLMVNASGTAVKLG